MAGATMCRPYCLMRRIVVVIVLKSTIRTLQKLRGMQLVCSLQNHFDRIWRIRYSPNGKHLITCSSDGTAILYNAAPSQDSHRYSIIQTFRPNTARKPASTIRDACFNPNSSMLVLACYDTNIYVYKLDDDRFIPFSIIEHAHTKEIKSIAISKQGTIASCARDRCVSVWQPSEDATGFEGDYDCLALLQAHVQDIKYVSFNQLGNMLLSCSYDNTIRLFKMMPSKSMSSMTGMVATEEDPDSEETFGWDLWSSALSEHNPEFYLSSSDPTVLGTTTSTSHTVWAAEFTHDGEYIVSADANGCLRLFQVAKDSLVHLYCLPSLHGCKAVYDLQLLSVITETGSRSELIITCGQDCSVCISRIDREAKRIVGLYKLPFAHPGEVNSVAASINGDTINIASCGDDSFARVWSLSAAYLLGNQN